MVDTTTMTPVFARKPLAVLAPLLAAALLAGCNTTGAGPAAGAAPAPAAQAAPPPEPEPPMTRARAAELCWMGTEKSSPGQNLDKRADAVGKCIEDKMKAAPKS